MSAHPAPTERAMRAALLWAGQHAPTGALLAAQLGVCASTGQMYRRSLLEARARLAGVKLCGRGGAGSNVVRAMIAALRWHGEYLPSAKKIVAAAGCCERTAYKYRTALGRARAFVDRARFAPYQYDCADELPPHVGARIRDTFAPPRNNRSTP